jgi:hypothetical protein
MAFMASGLPHMLWLRRHPGQTSLPDNHALTGCLACSTFDALAGKIYLNGDLQYLRKWVVSVNGGAAADKALTSGYNTVVAGKESSILLDFDSAFERANLNILSDSPPVTVRPNNCITITETRFDGMYDSKIDAVVGSTNRKTHRFLFIKDRTIDTSESVIGNYHAAYSTAEMQIGNDALQIGNDAMQVDNGGNIDSGNLDNIPNNNNPNDIVYKRGSLTVKVLPRDTDRSLGLLNPIKDIDLKLTMLVFLFAIGVGSGLKKKAQVSWFIVLGIIMLIMFSFVMIMVAKYAMLPAADTNSISFYAKDCLEQSAKKALVFLGGRGGDGSEEPFRLWYQTAVSSVDFDFFRRTYELEVSNRYKECMFHMPEKIRGVDIDMADPKVSMMMNKNDVIFTASYPASAVVGELRIDIPDQITTLQNRLLQTYRLANATAHHQRWYRGAIDLDALEGEDVTMTFFPHANQLMTFIYDERYDEYNFVIASQRAAWVDPRYEPEYAKGSPISH